MEDIWIEKYRPKVLEDVEDIDFDLNYDFLSLEKRLDNKLPDGTNIDVEIYFVFDGVNGGSIVDSNKMLLNTMFWPSSEKHLDLIEGILLHEYHHIGLIHWLEKYDNNFKKYSDGTSFAKYLMLSIMSEGAATYFFNDGDDIYDVARGAKPPSALKCCGDC